MQIPLARSELHLTELLEDVCNHMSDYGESVSSNGNRNFIRTSVRDGSGIKLDSVQIPASLHGQLKFAVCFNTDFNVDALRDLLVLNINYCRKKNCFSAESFLCSFKLRLLYSRDSWFFSAQY